jgi:phage repressor protein C with HTH and peptisase S24 domain
VSNNKQDQGVLKMTHEDVWFAIDSFAKDHKVSCSGLAKRSGLDATTFNKSKRWSKYGQPRWPSTNSIAKILESTGASLYDFTKYFSTDSSPAQQAI